MPSLIKKSTDFTSSLVEVAHNFSRQANLYDQVAHVQELAAARLNNLISKNNSIQTPHNILEIGCGTGILSKRLLKQFPKSKIYLLDPAGNMLTRCRSNLNSKFSFHNTILPASASFVQSTIESFLKDPQYRSTKFSLIASSFAFQWLPNLESVVKELISRLEIGGQLCFSYPITGSFPEWQASCQETNLPFTANQAPGFKVINSLLPNQQCSIYCEEYFQEFNYSDSRQFFKELKQLGAQTKIPKYLSSPKQPVSSLADLSAGELRRLIRTWNALSNKNEGLQKTNTNLQFITCTYKIIEGIITLHG